MKSMDSNKVVSIIVPVYNVENYLDECLSSISDQTYKNTEIILVNDGSTDGSLDICRAWVEKDKRIRLFDNENHGVSYTRNFGIDKSCGEYIAFVDSDDIIADNYIETLVELIEKENADMSIVSYCTFASDLPIFTDSEDVCVIDKDLENTFFTYTIGGIVGKLYRAEIIHHNKLRVCENIFVCEDLLFNIGYSKLCTSMAFNSSKLYAYRQRAESAAHYNTSLRWFTVLKAYDKLFAEYKNSVIFTSVVFYFLKFLYEAKYIMKNNDISAKDIDFDVSAAIKKAEKDVHILPFKKRIKLFVCKHFFSLVLKHRG